MSQAAGRALLDEYGRDHQSRGNEACHLLGIPLIVLALLGLGTRVPLYPGAPERLDLALLVVLAAFAFHLQIDRILAFTTLSWALTGTWLVQRLPPAILLGMFVLGWCFQLIGHARFERRRPSFTRRPVHLLVGPLWLTGRALGMIRPAAAPAEVRS